MRNTEMTERGGPRQDLLKQKYTPLFPQYPQLELHFAAIDTVQTRKQSVELSDEEREALLLYSLWTEDPNTTTTIADQAGITERELNKFVDLVTFELPQPGELVIQATQALQRQKENSETLPEPVITSIHLSRATEKAGQVLQPSHQTYDHPIPSKDQELLLFEHLKNGSPLDVFAQDMRFRYTIKAEDLESWGKVLAESGTVEDVIVNTTLRFIDVIARNFRNKGISHQDLVDAGNIGTIRALRVYDPVGPARFVGYAKYAIRYEMKKAVDEAAGIRLPSRVQQDIGKVRWVQEAFHAVFDREPTTDELRVQLLANTDLTEYRSNRALDLLLSGLQDVKSLDEKLSPDSEDERVNFIADDKVDIEQTTIVKETQQEIRYQVRRAISEYLTDQERRVVIGLFGIGRELEMSPDELASSMGVLREEIDVIRDRALGRMRYDEILRAHWDGKEDIPYFVYGASAERAAFRLGLFGERYMEQERVKKLLAPQSSKSSSDLVAADVEPTALPKVIEDPSRVYKEVLENLAPEEGIKVTAGKNETIESIKLSLVQAATELGKRIEISELRKGELLVEVKVVQAKTDSTSEEWNSMTTTEKILVLRNQGLSNRQIGEHLGIKPVTVTQKLARGTEFESLSSKVKRLRNEGYGNKEIAAMVGTTKGAVGVTAVRLIKKGEIQPLPRFGDPTKRTFQQGHDYKPATMPWDRIEEFKNQDGMSKEAIVGLVRDLSALGLGDRQIGELLSISRQSAQRLRRYSDEDRRALYRTEETEKVREYLEAHPRRSYEEGFRVIFNARERKPKQGRIKEPETIEFEKQVKELRLQGLTHRQIAEQLGTNWKRVQAAAHNLIQEGELEKRRTVDNPTERAEKIARTKRVKKQIKTLGKMGLNAVEIAEIIGESLPMVSITMWRMNREGQISATPEQIKPSLNGSDVDRVGTDTTFSSGYYKSIAEMRSQGKRNAEIAQELGIPLHQVEIYASNLILAGLTKPQIRTPQEMGLLRSQVLELKSLGLGDTEIANKLDVKRSNVRNALRSPSKKANSST